MCLGGGRSWGVRSGRGLRRGRCRTDRPWQAGAQDLDYTRVGLEPSASIKCALGAGVDFYFLRRALRLRGRGDGVFCFVFYFIACQAHGRRGRFDGLD